MKKKARKAGRPFKDPNKNVRDQILDAFLSLSHENSVESVTSQRIADKSKAARTSIRYHFEMHGESLTRVALDYVADKTYTYLDQSMLHARAGKNFDPIKSYIEAQFNWISEQPREASFLMYFYYLCTTKVSLKISNKELTEIGRRRVLSLLFEGIGMGLYSLNEPATKVGLDIHIYLTGALLSAATSRNSEFLNVQKNLCMDFVSHVLGIKASGPGF